MGVFIGANHTIETLMDANEQLFVTLRDNIPVVGNSGALMECVIFSKDRPIQLDALLSSFYDLVRPKIKITVLYDASTEKLLNSYKELISEVTELGISWVRQKEFRCDLIGILSNVCTPRVFFLVDDIVFTQTVNLDGFIQFDPTKYVCSLRLGENLDFCYTTNQHQPLPPFIDFRNEQFDGLCWCWSEGKLDWGYPLSVDGNIFDTREVFVMVQAGSFRAPNSFEQSLQIFNHIFQRRLGVTRRKSAIVNVPANKVQNENKNRAGDITAEEMLWYWEKGLKIDHVDLTGFNNRSCHQEVVFKFIPRTSVKHV